MGDYIVGRAINGISLNGLEYLLDDEGKLLTFKSYEAASTFVDENLEFGEYIIEVDLKGEI